MQSSNLATRFEVSVPDLLSEPPRPVLQVIRSSELPEVRNVRPRTSLEFRAIAIRDHGFRTFRVY
jgi:hypothetical protein